jgi:hypothetical protein
MNIRFRNISLMFGSCLLITLISTILLSCSEFKVPECVNEKEKDLSISWGTINNKTGIKSFYKLSTDLKIIFIVKDSLSNQKQSYELSLTADEFCDLKSKIQKLMVSKQSINFPGEQQQFLEYKNDFKNLYYAAIWNIEFTNSGNKELRSFFDFLNSKLKKK